MEEDLTERYTFTEYAIERIAAQGTFPIEQWDRLTCFGLDGESGEVVEMVKKHIFHGRPLNPACFHLELGDVLWYLNFGAFHHANADYASLARMAGDCVYFDEFALGHVALTTDPATLMGMATAHLTVDVGKIVAQLYFKEPWTAGARELAQNFRGVLWAITALAHVTGADLETIARLNNEKLRERYPHGFSVEAAQALKKDLSHD